MKQVFSEITMETKGQGLYNFTNKTLNWVNKQKINNGILNINILHTSASLIIQENADPDVLDDLKDVYIIFTMPNSDSDGRIIKQMIDEFVSSHDQRSISFTSI